MAKGKYEEWLTAEGLTKIEGWARDGLTDEQIAYNMVIRRETLYGYKNKYPNINNALKRGKEVVDRHVENALYNNAIGYHYTEQQVTNSGEVVTVEKYAKPHTTAQIFWLKNRKPDVWRDKTEQAIEHSGQVIFEDDLFIDDGEKGE